MKNVILVTGGTGMVGSQVEFGVKMGHAELDVLDLDSIRKAVAHHKPHTILHLAAMVDMLACEKNPDKAHEVNVVGTYNIAKICREKNIRLVYLSSCAVFDGTKKSPYKEFDRPEPINVYGRTKWLGEIIVKDLVPLALIIRTGWLFGGGLKTDKKFVKMSIQKLQKGLEVRATTDRRGSPTYIDDLLRTTQQLIHKDASGIFHVVNDQTASYYDIAKAIRVLGKYKPLVIPVKASEVEQPELKRGTMEALSSKKLTMRSWRDALKEYVEAL